MAEKRTIIEPFRIKMTESIKMTTEAEREKILKDAHYNLFLVPAEDCCIDLLTDSGTGAMSDKQWAALMLGDESYAYSKSWFKFESVVREITGMKHIFPTHQGRAAESILVQVAVKQGDVIPNNCHFDTTRANIEFAGAKAIDCVADEGLNPGNMLPFKGDVDIDKLKKCIGKNSNKIPFGMITVTNNTGGGQPVSMKNIKAVKTLLQKNDIPLIIDACRFAENVYFIHEREDEYKNKSIIEIAQEMFSYADGVIMSCKKDGIANIGGFFACNNNKLAENFKNILILREGFPTYGGLAGRDLEAISVGLKEALEYDYQRYRHATMEYLGSRLEKIGIPFVKPVGGHAVFLDAKAFLPHIEPLTYPGIGLINALYINGSIRSVEIGTVMFGRFNEYGNEQPAPVELVRLAFPRRVYTQSHFDYLIEVIEEVWRMKEKITGYKIIKQPKFLRHFSCHFEPLK
jgi:tryptophanase